MVEKKKVVKKAVKKVAKVVDIKEGSAFTEEVVKLTGLDLIQLSPPRGLYFSLGTITRPEWPVKEKYFFGRIMERVEREIKTYNKERQKILAEFGAIFTQDTELVMGTGTKQTFKKGSIEYEPNGNIVWKTGKKDKAMGALEELNDNVNELDLHKRKLNLSDLEDWEEDRKLKLTSTELGFLSTRFFEIIE